MSKHKWLLFAAVCFAWLTACSPKLPCPEAGAMLPEPGPGEEWVDFTIRNGSCMSLCVLLISPDHCEYMGGVNYVNSTPLPSEETITVQLPPGRYALWFELCTGEFRADEHIRVRSDTLYTFQAPLDAGVPPCGTGLTIVNNADQAICSLWIGNTESIYTGWNWLGEGTLPSGESLSVTLHPNTYFLRAEACDGTWLRSEVDVSISGRQTWTVP